MEITTANIEVCSAQEKRQTTTNDTTNLCSSLTLIFSTIIMNAGAPKFFKETRNEKGPFRDHEKQIILTGVCTKTHDKSPKNFGNFCSFVNPKPSSSL